MTVDSGAPQDFGKTNIALGSVLAAVLLTAMKLVVGLMTGSLSIMAEALHSGLDLGATVLTYVAVRISGAPPDKSHPYGHGKIEYISALVETLLLGATAVWIVQEAIVRLLSHRGMSDPNIWAFAVMAVSIVVDTTRSRALRRAARRYQSQALEADALHFLTDIWSSALVLVGLAVVKVGHWSGLPLAAQADAVAALGVAFIVLWIGLRMGRDTINVLMDHAPEGLTDAMREAAGGVSGVLACDRVRVRPVGPTVFADMVIQVPRSTPLEQAHAVASIVEERVRALNPRADVVVHVEPVAAQNETWQDQVQAIAAQSGLAVHDVEVTEVEGRRAITLHLEVDAGLAVAQAHEVADQLERAIKARVIGVEVVATHIETRSNHLRPGLAAPDKLAEVSYHLEAIAAAIPQLHSFHDVQVHRVERGLAVTLHCVFDECLPMELAHRASSNLEAELKGRLPEVERVLVHVEPPEAG